MLNHLLVVIIERDSIRLEIDLGPGHFLRIRRKGRDELGSRRAVEEVDGVTLAHAAEAGGGNLELRGCHGLRIEGIDWRMESCDGSEGRCGLEAL